MAGSGTGTGLDAYIGLAEEAFFGTSVTPDRFIEFISEAIKNDVQKIEATSIGRGRFARHDRTKTYARHGAGPSSHYVTNKAFAKIFKLIFGTHVITWPGSTNAARVLTLSGQAVAAETVTIGATVYTWRSSVSTTAFEVLIGATVAESIRNLANAINLGAGEGTYYGSLTTIHPTVVATYNATTLTATDKAGRGASATDATTETMTNGAWAGAALTGGVNGTDTRYTHTFTPDERGLRRVSATVQVNRPDTGGIDRPFTYPGAKVVGWKLSLALDGWLMLELTWDTAAGVTTTALATQSYASTAAVYDFSQFAVTVGGTAVRLKSFEVSGAWSVDINRGALGNTRLEPLAVGEWIITGALDAEFTDLTAYAAFMAGTQAALVITGTGITIPSSASPYLLSVTCPVIEYTGDTPTVGSTEILRIPLSFKAYNDGSNAICTVVYNTSDTAA